MCAQSPYIEIIHNSHFSFCKCVHKPLISGPARNGSFCRKVLLIQWLSTIYESGGQEFESLRARQQTPINRLLLRFHISRPPLGYENGRETISRNRRTESRKIPEVVHLLFALTTRWAFPSGLGSVVLAAGKHSRFYFPEFLLARPRDSTFEEFERGRALISSWSVEGMSALPAKADIG